MSRPQQVPMRRVGFVAPRSNTMCEQELNRLAPTGVSFHASRMMVPSGAQADDGGAATLKALQGPFEDLAMCDVELTLLACSSASQATDPAAMRQLATSITGTPFIDVLDAAAQALGAVGARRVAMFSPFTEASNQGLTRAFDQRGIAVISAKGLALNTSAKGFRRISRMTTDEMFAHVTSMPMAGAEAVLLACCDMPSMGVIDRLERHLDRPVVSMIQALYWAAMRALDVEPLARAPGRLFAPAPQPARLGA